MFVYEYSLKSYEVLLNLRDNKGNSLVQVRKLYYGPNFGPHVDTRKWGTSRITLGHWYTRPLTAGEAGDLKFAIEAAIREGDRLDELLPDGSKAPLTNLTAWDVLEFGKLV